MDLHPDFDFLPKLETNTDLNQFEEPSLPEISGPLLKELFAFANRFQALQPWNEIHENDLFGIRDPQSGALHIISVVGYSGCGFSLHCHMPPEGINFWQNAFLGKSVEMIPGLTDLRLLELSLVEESELTPIDRAMIKKYGKKLKKSNEMPCFRSYNPGYYPWYMTESEVKTLLRVFRLFFRFHETVIPQKSEFYQWKNPFGNMPGIPVFFAPEDADEDDIDQWQIKMEVLPSECLAPLKPRPEEDPDRGQYSDHPVVAETWEVGAFYMPTPVFRGARPYYPKSAVCLRVAGDDQYCPCDPVVYGGRDESDTEMIRKVFRDLVDHCGYLPDRIRVDSETTFAALETYADAFDLELILDEQELLPGLVSEILQSLDDSDISWEEELLGEVIRAIPAEFRVPLEEDRIEKSIEHLASKVLRGAGFEDGEKEQEEETPSNVIFADFASKYATGSDKS